MSQVKIAASFKKDEQPDNGFTDADHVAAIIAKPREERVATVTYRVLRVSDEVDEGTRVPTIKLLSIEPQTGERADAALQLHDEAREARTGRRQLPLDLDGQDAAERAEQEDPAAHDGADEQYADTLAAMKDDLDVKPTTCSFCSAELHFDPASGKHVDQDGLALAGDGHQHQPTDN
jgi:hypothetical protein